MSWPQKICLLSTVIFICFLNVFLNIASFIACLKACANWTREAADK
jgi:hypothetical protein